MSNEEEKTVGNNWNEYKRMILMELERLNNSIIDIQEKLNSIDKKITEDITKVTNQSTNKIHELEIRINTIETKVYLIATIASIIMGGIVSLIVKSVG